MQHSFVMKCRAHLKTDSASCRHGNIKKEIKCGELVSRFAFPASLELTKGLKSFDPQKDFICDNCDMLPKVYS